MSEIIRGTINGKAKYCRIPIRRKSVLLDMGGAEDDAIYLSAEKILALPHEEAAKIIDGIVSDWKYWLNRANELFVLYYARHSDDETSGECWKPI